MQISIAQLAALLNAEVVGDSDELVHTVAKIEEGFKGALSFLSNPKYEAHLYTTQSSAVLVNRTFNPTQPVTATLLKVDDAYSAFTFLLEKFSNPSSQLNGVSDNCYVHKSALISNDVYVGFGTVVEEGAKIGSNSKIYPQVFIGKNVQLGDNCIIYPGVKIYHECKLGNNIIIHSGTVIGSDGFGFAPQPDGSYKKIPQTGNVIIEDDVEIGANCSIDRATLGSTIIRKGVKLDNLIQIAHNVEIGTNTVIASQSGVAGSTKIGKNCIIAGQVGFVGHITIADGSQFGAQSGINRSIEEPNKKWNSTPAFELKDSLRSINVIRKLPEVLKRLEQLENQLKENK